MKHNVSDWALKTYQKIYENDNITKDDIFFYSYGIMHHRKYRTKYQAFLIRGLPRIPFAPKSAFYNIVKIGLKLVDLHLNYETCQEYPLGEPIEEIPDNPKSMDFGEGGNQSEFYVNNGKVYDNIPKIKYEVNSRTPVGWMTYKPKKSKAGINRYPFRLMTGEEIKTMLKRMVYVGLESDKLMDELEVLDFESIELGEKAQKELTPVEKKKTGLEKQDNRVKTNKPPKPKKFKSINPNEHL